MRGREVIGKWWKARKSDRGRELFKLCKYLREAEGQIRRREEDRHHMRLYANTGAFGAGTPRERAIFALVGQSGIGNRQRYNMLKSAVNTAASVIAQQRPRPMFLTTGGNFAMQRNARLRTRAIEGQFHDLGAYEIGPKVFVDAAVLGTGFVYGYLDPSTNKPAIERVLPLEIVVDHDECLDGSTRRIYRQRAIARDELEALFPSKKEDLKTSACPDEHMLTDLSMTRDTQADLVMVIEGWSLESYPGCGDGRHVMATSNTTLIDEQYTSKRLPFSVYRWSNRQSGYWGCGIVEDGRDAQWRINRLIARYERQNNVGASLYLLVEGNSKVRHESITTTDAEIIRYFGTPPQWMTGPGANPSIVNEIHSIREEFFSEQGISSMLAEGKKPAGLNSGTAQRAHDDIQSRRHIMNARGYEAFYMDLADLLVELNDRAAELDPSYSVDSLESRGRSAGIRPVRWLDVSGEGYRPRMYPTSALPTTPAGKMATVQEWIATGFISRPFAMSLLDFADVDAAARVELADLDFAMWQVEEMLDGRDVFVDEDADLTLCADIARRAKLQAQIEGAPDETIIALSDHARDCADAVKAMQAAEQAEAMAAQAQAMPPQDLPPGPMLPGAEGMMIDG